MNTPTSDPLSALAAELGHIGRRLDGMGVELLALRESAPSIPPASTPPAAPWASDRSATSTGGFVSPAMAAGQTTQAPPFAPPGGRGPMPQAGHFPMPPTRPGQIAPGAQYPPGWAPAGRQAPPAHPVGPRYPNLGYPSWDAQQSGPPAATPTARPRRSPLTGARLLAWTGGAVTLLGVVLLLALAASRGWFTPPARIAFGAVLGACLVGLGVWLHRRETARAGALALVATGFATLYLVGAAATAVYDYLPAVPALLLALVVAGAGLALADRWRTELLASGVVVGAALLAPALAEGWLLTALALALQLAALPVVLRRCWAVLMLLAAAGPVLYGVSTVLDEDNGAPDVLVVVGVAAAVLVIAVATAALAIRMRTNGTGGADVERESGTAAESVGGGAAGTAGTAGAAGTAGTAGTAGAAGAAGTAGAADRTAGAADRTAGARLWTGSVAAVVAASVLPALGAALVLDDWRGALVAGGASVLLAVLAVLPTTLRGVRVAAGTAAAVALLAATVVGLDGAAIDIAILGEALIAALLAVGMRSRFAMITALVLGALGGLYASGRDAPLSTLLRIDYSAPGVSDLVTAIAVSALLLALSAALLVAGGRLGWVRPDADRAAVWVPIGLVGLYGAASVVVNAALLISPTPSGFTAGHAVVTVSWTVGALFLLARGLRRPALRVTGLVLVTAAVAKLVLFDLVTLDGLARVGAFLGAGLVLMAAGTRYARLVAEAQKAPPSE